MEMIIAILFTAMVASFCYQVKFNILVEAPTESNAHKFLRQLNEKESIVYIGINQSPTPIDPEPIPPQEQPPEIIPPEQNPPIDVPPEEIPPEKVPPAIIPGKSI